jgi:heme/copper-type cytochrome/quinol oxidase subunit 3
VHVTVGVLMLVTLWARSMTGKLTHANSEVVENIGLYWHFVDIVWIVIFTAIYLIPWEQATL